MGHDAGTAHHSRRTTDAPAGFARAVESTERRILDSLLVIIRKCQFDQAVEVLEDFGIPLNRSLPVLVDAALQLGLGSGDLVRVWRGMVEVVGVGRDAFQMSRVSGLSPLCQQSKILEDVVLCVSSHP